MKKFSWACGLVAIACLGLGFAPPAPKGGGASIRMQKDTVGYAKNPAAVAALVSFLDSAEAKRFAANEAAFPKMSEGPMIGAICPHDDYLYAGRGYIHVMSRVKAPTVVIFGVSHTARRHGIQDKLIFDDFTAWRMAGKLCPISSVRDDIIKALPPDLVLVNDTISSEEHSIEGFVPLLQYFDPKVKIVPIIVTRIGGDLRAKAEDTLAAVLAIQFKKHGWKLGRDVQILISADGVHYGDDQWGGRNYAPFGVDTAGYLKAVAQDKDIIESSLVGTLSAKRIATFTDKVENCDFQQPYKVTWCGVYSIPFGLSVLARLSELSHRPAPQGFMLAYGTSIDPPRLPLEGTGLGVTAIATLRHWVSYTAVGYW
jgi:AmmeMemoRadiSam system protein B